MEIKGFTFFRSYRDAANQLPEDERLRFYEMIVDYGLDGKEPTENDSVLHRALFALIKPTIDKSTAHAKAGFKGGRPPTVKAGIVDKHAELKEWAKQMDEETKQNQK